jgi:hypothetical protein
MKRAAVFTIILVAVTAVGLLAGCGSARGGGGIAAAGASVLAADQSVAARSTVVVNCTGKQQTRPPSFILTCTDAGDVLTRVHWVSWGASQAFGTGTEMIKTCEPNCAAGGFASYPVLITLWRPESLPGHPGVLYFTRATRIYTANRPPLYFCHGSQTCYPLTSTFDLWSTQAAA